MTHPILVTGAARPVSVVGSLVVKAQQRRGLPVRAMVRREDERAEALFTASAYRFVRLFSRGKRKTRLIAVVPHPRDAKAGATPESKRE